MLKSLINPSVSTKQRNTLLASWYLFEDSDKIKFQSIDLFYEAYKITENFALGVDGGLFSIEQAGKNKYNGKRFGISAFYDKFKVRLGINKYDDFSEIVPSIEYKNKYKKHEYTLGYIRQNALFYTYSLVPYEKRIVSDHFTLSDYAEFEDKTSLWASAEVDNYSNGDLAATVQFDWNFYYDTVWTPNFTYTLALEGYYTAHSKQHNDFYSPSFDDATLLRFNPQYIFSKSVGIKGSIGAGHSVTGESIPYKYGGWVFGTPIENMSYMAGCLYNSTVRTSLVQGTYNFTECKADLGYSW